MPSCAGHRRVTLAPTHEEAPGVHRIVIPTPWMKAVNVYILEGDPLTVVDTGPGLTASTAALTNTLAALGHELTDVELIVLTHQHLDHMGAALRLVERSGAEVAAFGPSAGFLEDWHRRSALEDDWIGALAARHGVPVGTARAVRMISRLEKHLAEPVRVDVPLLEGEVLRAGGRAWRVGHRPGHSPSDVVLHCEADGLLLAGDHLLGHVTSNALLAMPLDAPQDGPLERPRALLDYRQSLARTRDTDVRRVLPGHGEPFGDVPALVDRRLAQQNGRAATLYALLGREPRSAFALAEAVWGGEASAQTFLVLSEVLGHLDLLVADLQVEERDDGERTTFVAI